jgi:hypothetical protein
MKNKAEEMCFIADTYLNRNSNNFQELLRMIEGRAYDGYHTLRKITIHSSTRTQLIKYGFKVEVTPDGHLWEISWKNHSLQKHSNPRSRQK